MGDLVLGVEGGHHTQAIVATAAGEVLGRGLAAASNPHRVGVDKARSAIETAIASAMASAGGPSAAGLSGEEKEAWATDPRIGAAFFGLSGVDGPEDEAVFASWLAQLGCTFKYAIRNDSELVLGGGTPEGWGVALISGTGSICLGRSPRGQTARVGGWGHAFGDEGSGYQIATEALRLATQEADGRGGSAAMLQAALGFWKLREPRELIATLCRKDTTAEDIAGFAGRVIDLAGRNDPTAFAIAERAAAELARHVDTVVKKLALKDPPLALGGLMFRVTLKKMLLEKVGSPLGPVTVVTEPAMGAVASARRLLQAA